MTCGRIMQIRTATFLEIDYDPESVEQDVLLELMQDAGRVEQLSILALLSRQPRISSRLREHRRYTHPLIVILGREAVNRPGAQLLSRFTSSIQPGRLSQRLLFSKRPRIASLRHYKRDYLVYRCGEGRVSANATFRSTRTNARTPPHSPSGVPRLLARVPLVALAN